MANEDPVELRARIIAKAWSDEDFKRRLLSDPAATLKAEGVDVPAGREVRVIEDTPETVHYVLPAKPGQVSDEDLEKVAGGRIPLTYGGGPPRPSKLGDVPRAMGTPPPGSTQMGDIPPEVLEILLRGNAGC